MGAFVSEHQRKDNITTRDSLTRPATPTPDTIAGPVVEAAERPAIPNVELFTDAELEALKLEAAKVIDEDLKKLARAEALKHFTKAERARRLPAEEQIEYMIDLPGYAMSCVVDNVTYFHGKVYKVSRRQYASLRESVQNAWRHERNIGGANANAYRQPSLPTISGTTLGVTSRSGYLAA